jgi:hypothetical protein
MGRNRLDVRRRSDLACDEIVKRRASNIVKVTNTARHGSRNITGLAAKD